MSPLSSPGKAHSWILPREISTVKDNQTTISLYVVQYVTSEIFVHARHICIVAKSCLVACQNILFFNFGVLLHTKNLFPFTMQGDQAYAKFKAPIETGLQTTCWIRITIGIPSWIVDPLGECNSKGASKFKGVLHRQGQKSMFQVHIIASTYWVYL